MSDYIRARNERERVAAVRASLLFGIELLARNNQALFAAAKQDQAKELARVATNVPQAGDDSILIAQLEQEAHSAGARRRFDEVLRRRRESALAGAQLEKLVVPALSAWAKQIKKKAENFLEVEDDLDDDGVERHLKPMREFLEAARAFDACFMVLSGRFNVPYR